MKLIPRPYQRECLDAISACYARDVRKALVVLPTGTGKTNIFSWLIESRRQAGDRRASLIVAHREELLDQAANRVRSIMPGITVGIEQGTSKVARGSEVVVASVQTVSRPLSDRLAGFKPGLVIIDECHHAAAKGYGLVIDRFAGDWAHVLGVTATPSRLDNKELHGSAAIFEEVAYTYPIRQAIQDGYLADIRAYRVQSDTDLGGVRQTQGDFAQGELSRRVDDPARTASALRHWREVAGDLRTIAFCAGVEHAHHVAEQFREQGIAAEAVDGGMHSRDRSAIIQRFRDGRTQALVNCEIATEGFDVPEAACALLLRPTKSWALYVQMVGRVLRIADGKPNAVVIDVVDNCDRHNLATVPAILGLPPGLDLEGNSLLKAAQAIDEMGEKAAALQGVLPGSWTELQTILRQVDLFAVIETPAMIREAGAAMHWLSTLSGYELSCGQGGRRARMEEDALGHWTLKLSESTSVPGERATVMRQQLRGELAEAVMDAERRISEWWPDSGRVTLRDSAWRRDAPTEKQIHWLRKMDTPESVIAALTKGSASALLDQLWKQKRGGAVARR